MKHYRHYKNKPYKFLDIVKHSETLEEMALYQCLYDNKQGKLWVRPKDMFFENIVLDGKETPRFKKIELDIVESSEVGPKETEVLSVLIKEIFGEWDSNWFFSTYNNHKKYNLLIGYIENKPVAFKLGYELDSTCFYSWLGGVLPEYRTLGIASDLMAAQHDWCRKNKYPKVQTKTENKFKEMLLLDIQNGFEITGTHVSAETGKIKIVLEKQLYKKST